MADLLMAVLNGVKKRFRDMGDGSFAENIFATTDGTLAPSGQASVTGTFDAGGQQSSFFIPLAGRPFNLWTWSDPGSAGTLFIERSFDGVNWFFGYNFGGYSGTIGLDETRTHTEFESGISYRLSSNTRGFSGSAHYRISQ